MMTLRQIMLRPMTRLTRTALMFMMVVTLFLPVSSGFAQGVGAAQASVAEIVLVTPELSMLGEALEAAGLLGILSGEGAFTLFAPTDEAFAQLGEEALQAFMEDPEALANVLSHHMAVGDYPGEQIAEFESVLTVQGGELMVSVDAAGLSIGGANILQSDLSADNGTVHVVDAVLIPPEHLDEDEAEGDGSSD